MVRAEQTGLWHIAPDGTELERLAPPKEPEYDFERIASQVAQLEQYDAAWLTWFHEQGIEPLSIGYESLSANPTEAVSRICRALSVPEPAPDSLKPGVAKLADAISLEWMRQYRLHLMATTS
jgi:trehalose 2-sulfotransferase